MQVTRNLCFKMRDFIKTEHNDYVQKNIYKTVIMKMVSI